MKTVVSFIGSIKPAVLYLCHFMIENMLKTVSFLIS